MNNIFDISVIIPVYNAQEYIMRCLETMKSQTFRNFEIIIIDDCSGDRSEERRVGKECRL